MINLMKKDIVIVSEGKQIRDKIEAIYGSNGLKVFSKNIGLSESTLIKYLQYYRLDSVPNAGLNAIKNGLGEEFEYKTIDNQIVYFVEQFEKVKNKSEEDIELIEKVCEIAENAIDNEIIVRAKVQAISCNEYKKPIEAVNQYYKLLAKEKISGELEIRIYFEIAFCYFTARKFDLAVEITELIKKNETATYIDIARAYHAAGMYYWMADKYRNAEIELKKALELYEGNKEKQCAIMNLIGVNQIAAKKKTSAKRTYEKAIEMLKENVSRSMAIVVYNNAFDAWIENQIKADEYSMKAIKLSEDAEYFKSKFIAHNNRIRYEIKYGKNREKVKQMTEGFKGIKELGYLEMSLCIKRLALDARTVSDGEVYVEIIRDSIIDLVNNEKNQDEIEKYHQLLGMLVHNYYQKG